MMRRNKKLLLCSILIPALLCLSLSPVYAAGDMSVNINGDSVETLDIMLQLTLIMLLPSILVMMTSFTRIVIVLSFLRNALGLQQTPPNQVLIGIAIFLSLFVMSPVLSEINTQAYEPYQNQQITQQEFFDKATVPIKEFMLKQTKNDDLDLFVTMADIEQVEDIKQLPMNVVIPAFMTSELKRAFTIGFLLFIPFLIIDIIVSSTLMSMGMIMLPPAMISLPFKLLLFVLVDGWGLLFKTLVMTFN